MVHLTKPGTYLRIIFRFTSLSARSTESCLYKQTGAATSSFNGTKQAGTLDPISSFSDGCVILGEEFCWTTFALTFIV